MAKVISTSQQLTHAALAPMSIHSRVINLDVEVPAGVGFEGWALSDVVAENMRILGMDLMIMSRSLVNIIGGFIYVQVGSGLLTVGNPSQNNYEHLINNKGMKPGLFYLGFGNQNYHWSMNRRFAGQPWRINFFVENFSAVEDWHIWASLQISEG